MLKSNVILPYFTPSSTTVDDTVNLALNKPAYQSAVLHEGVPGRAVDGNANTLYGSNSCTHTPNSNNPWWAVDLAKHYKILAIDITNRGEGLGRNVPVYLHELDIAHQNDEIEYVTFLSNIIETH